MFCTDSYTLLSSCQDDRNHDYEGEDEEDDWETDWLERILVLFWSLFVLTEGVTFTI